MDAGVTVGPTRQGTRPWTRGVTLREAAEVLGVSKEAVRKRVKRGSLRSVKGEDGMVYVYLPASPPMGEDAVGDRDQGAQDPAHLGDRDRGDHGDLRDALIAELRAEVEAWREESRRKDHIIAGLVERLPPQLEAPQTTAEDAGGSEPRPATEDAQEGSERRSWWRRWFGG